MQTALTQADKLFSDTIGNPAAQSGRLLEFEGELLKSQQQAATGYQGWDPETRTITKGINSARGQRRAAEVLETLEKAYGAGSQLQATSSQIAEIRSLIAESGNIAKNWSTGDPVSASNPMNLAPYDLQGPSKILVPFDTPLRNSIPRERGQGNAATFRAITSFSNDGLPNGVGVLTPFFNSQTSSVPFGGPGNVNLNRPPKIDYDGDEYTYRYVEQGFSDQVNWITQFQSLGFDNARALSHTGLLWATMLGEERAILYGRGATGGGYSGIVAAPSGITTGTATTGGTLAAATYYVYIAAVTGFGQSAVSTVASQVTTGSTSTVTVTVGTEPTGALYYNYYVGTTTGIGNAHLQGSFAGNTVTFTSYNASGAVIAGTDSSFDTNAYDGILTVQTDPARSGYFERLNGALSTTNPGVEIDTALATMWQNNRANPDEVWMTGPAMAIMSQALRIGGTSGYGSGYVTNINTGANGIIQGGAVVGAVNPVTRSVVSFRAHPFMPQGCMILRSTSLPMPASGVPAPIAIRNVQEYMALDWPVIQMSYDASTYLMGTLMHYAPGWSGAIVGITNG